MFVEIDNKEQNVMFVTSIQNEEVTNNGTTIYRIRYIFSNGSELFEDFETESERNARFEEFKNSDCKDTFINIDDRMINLHYVASFTKDTENNVIRYRYANGDTFEAEFDTPQELDKDYEELVEEAHIDLTPYAKTTEVEQMVSRALKVEFVDELPQQGQPNLLYLVRVQGTQGDIYDEYIFDANGNPEKIGSTRIDLTPYATKTYSDDNDTSTLNSAKSYSDSQDAATLSSAKDYADQLFGTLVNGDEVEF